MEIAKDNKRAGECGKDTDRYIDRPFNIRPMCFWALLVAVMIVFCFWSVWAVLAYFAVLIVFFWSIQFVRSKDKFITFIATSRGFFIGTVVLCLAATISFAVVHISYTAQKSYAGEGELVGVVYVRAQTYLVLSDAQFEGRGLSGKVAVYMTDTEGIETTSVVSAFTAIRVADASDYNINNGIKYTASVREVNVVGDDMGVRSVVLRYAKRAVANNTMYSMIFGDRSLLEGDVQQSFSFVGLAHVLAVSGLHVGIIVGIFVSAMRAVRLSRKKQFAVLFFMLGFYSYLCGWRYSILRASIMFLVFAARRAFLQTHDLLSSISAAAIVIMILFPHSIASASFQLSFACLLGIAFFALPFEKLARKVIRWEWLCKGIAVYFATFVFCMPLLVRYFGFISIVGLFANVFLLPIIIVCFQASFIVVVTYVAFPVMYIVNPVMRAVTDLTKWMANLKFSYIEISSQGYWHLFYLVGLVFCTRFIFCSRIYKYTAAAILIGIYSFFVLLYNI